MKHRIRWENKNFDDMGTLSFNDGIALSRQPDYSSYKFSFILVLTKVKFKVWVI